MYIHTCAVCSSSIYWFWLPLWYLQTLLTMHVQCKQGLWMFVVKRIHDCANYECRICWWKTIYLILWLFFVFFTGERKICSITCDFFFSVSDWIFERSWPRLFKDFSAFQTQVLVDRTLPPFSWTSIFFSCKQHFATLYVSLDDIYTINTSK